MRINLQTWPQVSPSFLSPLGFKMRVLPWNSKLPQAKISKLVEWAQGRPFPGVDTGFQSLGFRYQRVSSWGKVLWTAWFCPHIPWGLSPHLPLTTAQRSGGRGRLAGRGTHTLCCPRGLRITRVQGEGAPGRTEVLWVCSTQTPHSTC